MIAKRMTMSFTLLIAIATFTMTGCANSDRSTTVASGQTERYQTTSTQTPSTAEATPPPAQTQTRSDRSFTATSRTSGNMTYVSMAYPTGDPQTSAIGIEKAVPREVRVNNPFTYTLKVTNLTNQELSAVVVSEKIASNMKITASSPRGQASQDGTVMWPLGSLKPNDTQTVNVTAVISERGIGSSCASVTYSSSLCTNIEAVEPKLLIALAGPSQVLACEEINYTVRVTNTGTGTVENIRVSQPLPDGMTTKDGKKTVDLSVAALGPDESKPFTVPVQASKPGTYTFTAAANSAGGLSAKSNQVTTVVRKPSLTITKKGPAKAFIGRSVTYEVVVTNKGDGIARNVVVEDILSTGAEMVRASAGAQQSGNVVRWNLDTLEPDKSRKIEISLKGVNPGLIRNTARARAYCAQDVSASAETVFEGIPAILLEVIDLEDPIEVGGNVVYQITATNQGTANGTNVKIDCNLEENIDYVSATGATQATTQGRTVSFAPVTALEPGQKVTWRLVVKAVKAGDVRFQVSLTSDQLSRPVNEDEATNIY